MPPQDANPTPSFGGFGLNDIVLDEAGVSRQHAGIRGDTEGYWIADLGQQERHVHQR